VLRQRSLVLVALAIAVPATAQTFGFPVRETAAVCLSIGEASYRIAAPGEHADYVVRIDPAAAAPDVRVQLTGTIDEADFVFIDGSGSAAPCLGGKTVKINAAGPADLTVGFASSSAPADYRIYVRSRSLAPEEAAALYAAAHLPARRLAHASGSN
jgi:fructose-specific component phosphotransferase system IIB-like protein